MEALITRTEGLIFVILIMVAFALWLQRFKAFKSLGPVLTVVVLGIILSNTHVVPISHDFYSALSTYCVTPAISICLLSMNMRELKKLNREPVIALVSAIFSVCFIAIILGLFFAPRITEGWKCAGMFVGTYTGGTPNLTAIATGLDCSGKPLRPPMQLTTWCHPLNGISVRGSGYLKGVQTLEQAVALPVYKRGAGRRRGRASDVR